MSFIKAVYDKQSVKNENQVLQNEILLGQYESLKNQISPHFMFNSLTALRELIDQNAADAKLYVSHLSLVLRYTLSSIESKSKCLYEELEVAESYMHLVKIRFGSSIKVETNVDYAYKNHRLPPLAIQTLLENAIKHNEISKKNPFTIRIETGNDQVLSVTNTIQEKVTKEFSSGLGLSNLSKQYQYLGGKEITISNNNNEFRVELPLLKPSSDEGLNS
jgi:LytS/YehU family sensor histidine kinase